MSSSCLSLDYQKKALRAARKPTTLYFRNQFSNPCLTLVWCCVIFGVYLFDICDGEVCKPYQYFYAASVRDDIHDITM